MNDVLVRITSAVVVNVNDIGDAPLAALRHIKEGIEDPGIGMLVSIECMERQDSGYFSDSPVYKFVDGVLVEKHE